MIALVGQSVVDITTWPDGSASTRLGGAPVFGASAVAGMHPAVVLTHGGTSALRRPLHELGVPVVVGPSERTSVFEVTLHGDGTWSESLASIGNPFTPADVESWMAPALARCSTVVCGAQLRGDFPPETLAALAAGGRTVYLDGQGAARPRRLGAVCLEGPLDPEAVAGVTVLKLAEEEAEALLGRTDPARAKATGVPVVVVTRAERGAVLLAEGEAIKVGVDPVVGLADTVGAGDSFLALMAAAVDAGAGPLEASWRACVRVARILRARLLEERARTPAAIGALRP